MSLILTGCSCCYCAVCTQVSLLYLSYLLQSHSLALLLGSEISRKIIIEMLQKRLTATTTDSSPPSSVSESRKREWKLSFLLCFAVVASSFLFSESLSVLAEGCFSCNKQTNRWEGPGVLRWMFLVTITVSWWWIIWHAVPRNDVRRQLVEWRYGAWPPSK